MENYFFNLIPKEELEKLPYLPTLVDLLENQVKGLKTAATHIDLRGLQF